MSILVIFITGKQNGGYHRKLPASLLLLHFNWQFFNTMHTCFLPYGDYLIVTPIWLDYIWRSYFSFWLHQKDYGREGKRCHLILCLAFKESHIKTILSGTSSSIRTKLWWKSLDGPFPKLCPAFQTSDQDGCTAELSLT